MRGSVDSNMTSTCIQGGFSRPFGGYQPNFIKEPHSAAPAWQMQHSIVPKQEPIDEDRNDSGINSGSDVHSPGSETGQDFHRTALYTHLHNQQDSSIFTYYSNPLTPRISTAPLDYNPANHNNSEFNNAEVPQPSNQDPIKNESKPENMQTDNAENEDPLRRLESALENNRLLQFPQPSSPRISEHSGNKSDDGEPDSDLSIRVPRMNSHGKMKSYKCKQCNYLCYTKLEFWEHSKTHIKEGKMLTCTKCPFVTEYKHHLEYHMRNHTGSKPYKCSRCNYSCVNKSMLNSHLKSHSNVYQYRCSNCTYVSKYCHSLKLHLRKYDHQPAMVLNPDGTPNPYPIVDVYGTRRGPKQKHASKAERPKSPTNNLQTQFAQFLSNPVPQIPLPLPYHLLGELQARLQTSMMYSAANVENFSKVLQPSGSPEPEKPTMDCSFTPPPNSESQESQQALDLRKPDPKPTKPNPPKNRRKGQAFKLGNFPINDTSDDEDDEDGFPRTMLPSLSSALVNGE